MHHAANKTKLTTNSSLHCCNGYNVLRKDRTRRNGGGIAFIIHNAVQYRALSLDLTYRDQYLEIQAISIRSRDVDLELYNVYIQPVASCPTGYRPDIRSILDGNIRLVLGDFNAHHQLWHSRLRDDQRGALLAKQIDESTFCTLNDDAPTRIMGTCASSPDITLASAGLINCTTWQTVVSLGSDHLHIIVSLERPNDFIVSERRTYMNQKKADWRGFREFTDRRVVELPVPSNIRITERKFRETINAAVARFVPSGRISVVRPHFPAEAARLADERDDIRNTNPSDPRIAQLNTARHQHGFRKMHSTTTALTAVTTQIAHGLNHQKPCERTIKVAIDLSKAFDTRKLFTDNNLEIQTLSKQQYQA
ncbi:uncharacterized protein ACRADG_012793 [Cochliomyia hominivorax]